MIGVFIPVVSLAAFLFAVFMLIFVSHAGGPNAGAVGRFAAAEISAKYILDPRVNFFRVNVTYDQGTIILDGTVDTAEDKAAAEELAYQVSTIKHVINNLRIEPRGGLFGNVKERFREASEKFSNGQPETEQVDAGRIGEAGARGLADDPTTASRPSAESDARLLAYIEKLREEYGGSDYDRVAVSVKNGVVTLSGSVESKLLQLRARLELSKIPGVVEVKDKITVAELGDPSETY